MASIIPDYNYDIFISYRQKDNKGDRWVSRFVESLKTELEAAFKEDVSAYFDENPHDRLQETHNVNKSLEGKLKCLIFIPVLSQTYCDPASYAWQYEFLAFIKMTEDDRFGKDIKLRSGNVASRVLPIRIHDLEPEDVKLFEKETGSVLRAMDFVFRTSTGVNRPLKVNEDHPQDNLNKTFYADQINKVARAIKEIIQGMKTEPLQVVKEKDLTGESVEELKEEEESIHPGKPAKHIIRKLFYTTSIIAILIIAGIITYPRIFKRDALADLRSSGERISVAVIPFQNMTNDTIWNVWQNGIQNELITSLTNSEELQVRQLETITGLIQSKGFTNTASITPSVASLISQKLDADVFIYGSIKQVGNSLRVNAQLTDSKTENTFKSFQIDGTADNILHITDSLSKMIKNFLIISVLNKEVPSVFRQIEPTNSPEAYRYLIYGNKAFNNRDYSTAGNWYTQALAVDSNFTIAAIYLSVSYANQSLIEEGRKWCMKVYDKRDLMPLNLKIMTNWLHASYFETPHEEIKYLKQSLEVDDQRPLEYFILGNVYNGLNQFDKAIPEYEKALEITDKWGAKPMWVLNYTNLGRAYHETGQYRKEKRIYKKAEQDFPDNDAILYRQAILALAEGKTKDASEYIEKYKSIRKERSAAEAAIANSVAMIYNESGIMNKAEEYYRQALSLEPENPVRLNNLAWFLIDNDQNIDEGLELIEKALKISPDIDYMLDTKGWGLYKKGRNQEALEILQKSWELRTGYSHEMYLHLEAVKKAVAGQK